MAPKTLFERLTEEGAADLVPTAGLPKWESHANFSLLVTPNGIAVLITAFGKTCGIVRYPDRSSVEIEDCTLAAAIDRAEGLLIEKPSTWAHLDRDVLDPGLRLPQCAEPTIKVHEKWYPPRRNAPTKAIQMTLTGVTPPKEPDNEQDGREEAKPVLSIGNADGDSS